MEYIILIIGFVCILLIVLSVRKSCHVNKSEELRQKVDKVIAGNIKIDEEDLKYLLAEFLADTKQAREMETIDEATRVKNIERADKLFDMLTNLKDSK